MKKGFYLVMTVQSFSSLADNALFIAAIALILELNGPEWMAPLMKWSFALSYVLLAAFVGTMADTFPKGKVMFATNLLKIAGCFVMFFYANFGINKQYETYIICMAYGLVGIGAAAYSPAKYGIVTEMLPAEMLVKGNSWIEGLTVFSIVLGIVLGGALLSSNVSDSLLSNYFISKIAHTPAESAIFVISLIYWVVAVLNLAIPKTNASYPSQHKNPIKLITTFTNHLHILWTDKVGQITLAVTTLFWGAGTTLQLLVIEWGKIHLGYSLDQTSTLIGMSAIGTVIGSIVAGHIALKNSLMILPVGLIMGLMVLLMPFVTETWSVYTLLLIIGVLAGFFVVPMNALLQHRGHCLLSAGHSIAVQNFNEQLSTLLMVAIYTVLLSLEIHINTIIITFGLIVLILMIFFLYWSYRNFSNYPLILQPFMECYRHNSTK